MKGRRSLALVLLLVGAGSVCVGLLESRTHWLRGAAIRGMDWIRIGLRRAGASEDPPLSRLAVSQVGYGPGMRKEFTSGAPFSSFEIQDARTTERRWSGPGPLRTVETDLLGASHTVWVGDFSAVTAPGRYRIVANNGLTSFPFTIAGDVFDAPLRAVQRSFYYQRAFTSVAAPHAEGPWTHPTDEDKAPPGVRGGWHDAGDFSIYSASLNAAVYWLLAASADFSPQADDTNIPESGNGLPDLLDEARWGLTWLLAVRDETGGFRNTTCQQSYGPYGTNTPQSVPHYVAGEVGTFATARAVGTLAFAAVTYRQVDPGFAGRCLQAARDGLRYLDAHPGENSDGPTCPAARRDGDQEIGRSLRMFSAAGMLLATAEPRFRDDFEQAYVSPSYDPRFLHLDGQAALLYLRAPAGDPDRKRKIREQLRLNADLARKEGRMHPFQWATRYHWGSLGAGFKRALLSSARLCLEDPAGARDDCEQAMASVHYLFGRNSRNFCYVSGLSGVSRGAIAGFHHWLATLDAHPRDFPGIIPGGPCIRPEPADRSVPHARPRALWGYWGDPAFPRDESTPVDSRYTDNDSWSTNESSIEWQGEAVYLLHLARWLARGAAPAPSGP